MMSDLACVRPEQIVPGMIIVTKETAEESSSRGAQLNLVLRAYIEAKAAHFREAIYIITEICSNEASDGSDAVRGVNLSRTLEAPDVLMLEDAVDEETIWSYAERGVEVQWMNGGPCKPKLVTALACVQHVPQDRRASADGVSEVLSGEGVIWGDMSSVLALAAEEAEIVAAEGGERSAVVLAWAGHAQWSRTQLLGEVARGSWGWCLGSVPDVQAAITAIRTDSESLWRKMRYSERLLWAPSNELSRDFERQVRRATAQTQEAEDPHAETLGALVQLFEARRRGSEPAVRGPARTVGGRAAATRACAQQ